MKKIYCTTVIGVFIYAINIKEAKGQVEQQIRIIGQVYDPLANGLAFSLMVINKTTGQGTYGESNGSFNIVANQNDSILLSTRGYQLIKLSFSDSVFKELYNINLPLQILKYDLKPVTIFAQRDLAEIKEDIDKLGFNEKDYKLSGVDAVSSPITFLYQSLSKKEQGIRKAYEYENEMRRRDLLKELFAKYAEHDIIALEYENFDRFIDFCQVSDNQLKQMSQYDFIMYIKERYRVYSIIAGDDYYFDK